MNQQPQQPQPRRKKKSPLMLLLLLALAYFLFQQMKGGNQAPQNQQTDQTVMSTEELTTQTPTTQAPTNQVSENTAGDSEAIKDISWDKVISGQKDQTKSLPDTEAKEDAVLKALTENFDGQAKVDYDADAKAYVITPIAKDMIDAMTQALNQPQEYQDDWQVMVQNLQEASKTYQDVLGQGYEIQLANPDNAENMLVQVKDGQVVYDAMQDGQ